MSDQEVFDMLSELESFFYYRMQNPKGIPYRILAEMHTEADTMLKQWHNMTGCTNN